MPFERLLAPGRIGALELRNRAVFAATSAELANLDGYVTDEMIEYYAERARGGVGLIVIETTYVEQEGKRLHHNPMLNDERYIPRMRKMADAIHAVGAKVVVQLNHGGRESLEEVTGSPPLAPSPISSKYIGIGEPVVPKELTLAEISRIVTRFGEAAARAKTAGFDGIELHAAHGYLIWQFLSPVSNRREDAYGGNTKKRARFCIELIRAIKDRCGEDFPVICRINGRDYVPGGLELEEAVEIAALLEEAGADSISVSGGVHSSRPYMIAPGMSVARGCFASSGKAVKARVRVPVMTVGRINTPQLAEQLLGNGEADFVCLSRALIADPHFVRKAAAGTPEQIRPCIACNECAAAVHRHRGIACTVNPFVSRELELKPILTTPAAPKRIAVIGGGAAGMSAAITAATRGHHVHLFEKTGSLGGQLILAHAPPHREEIENLLHFFIAEIRRLNIDVRFNSALSPEDAGSLGLDAIIVATGASPVRPAVPGMDRPHVLDGWRILAGTQNAGETCVVIGGGLVGIEVADFLVERGSRVALIARSGLLKKAVHSDRVYFFDRIRDLGIEVFENTDVIEIGVDHVIIQPKDRLKRRLEGIDNVIFCTGYEAPATDPASQSAIPKYFVGDALGPRKFFEAIEEGTLVALKHL